MKVLIVYSTKTGVSKRCAHILEERLRAFSEVSVFDIKDAPPTPYGFDVAVIGGSIRATRLDKRIKKYLKQNIDILNSMHTALFLCCGYTENFDDYVALHFPKALTPTLGIHCFGGELKPEKLKGFDKLVVKMLRSELATEDFEAPDRTRSPLPEILPETIYRLADSIRNTL